MFEHEVPVLIVGGSLVGLSSALLLGHHGIKALAVEHHRGTAIHPRAAQISQRTMEIFRTVGIEQIVRQTSAEQFVQDGAIMAVETLAGKEIGYFIADLNDGVRDVSPTERVFISQSLLEPLLRARAEAFGAELRFATEMVSFEHDSAGVTAVIRARDSGKTDTVRASYMIAADGAHSSIRERLGIPMRGHGVFSHSVTIYFRADVAPLLRGRNLSVIYVNNPVLRGFFRFEKPFDRGFLAVNAVGRPDNPVTDVSTGLTEEGCLELIHAALGVDDIPITIETVMTWSAAADVAVRYQQGRVFLAGDAAHVMPPNGGFGGNTGVQDADNLAWKLAAVLHGAAGPGLLATYEAERRPVGELTAEQAYARYVTRTAPYLGTDDMQPVEHDLNIELGYGYRSEAVCADDEGGAPMHENPRNSKGRPGTRAPHVWLRRDGEQISTLDLFGARFVLLAGREGQSWCDGAREAASQLDIDVDVHLINGPTLQGGEAFAAAYWITPGGAVLVRPDGFVGWRAARPIDGGVSACTTELVRALTTLTCRDL
jgi:2-polyprenyl-6-methoxyphenol hydroxylase-like FAD-dependent oxidoreductase